MPRGEGFAPIAEWIEQQNDSRLVIIDTWAKVRPPTRGPRFYDNDIQALEEVLGVMPAESIGIQLIHHFNQGDHDDWTESVSGTAGVTGAVDTVLGLSRDRTMADGRLRGTGRDIDEFDYAVTFNSSDCRWSVQGDTARFRMTSERREVIEYVEANGPSAPQSVAEDLDRSHDSVRQLMRSMSKDGQLSLVERGLYDLPPG